MGEEMQTRAPNWFEENDHNRQKQSWEEHRENYLLKTQFSLHFNFMALLRYCKMSLCYIFLEDLHLILMN
jgi:hypothetical protein